MPHSRILTEPFIRSLEPAAPGQRYAVADALVPGLKVRVTDKGAKSFILWRRYGGAPNPAARTLGSVGQLSLAEAREKARGWLKLIGQGADPRALERATREAERERRDTTFRAVLEDYFARHVRGQRKAQQVIREMRKDLLPFWKDKPVTDITRKDVIRVIEAIVDRGAPRQAHSVLSHIKTFFNWAIERGTYGLERSPVERMKPARQIGPKRERQRFLDDNEIRAFWRAASRMSYPSGPKLQLLLLTGTRKNEVAGAMWREIDFVAKVWTIPPERFKSDAKHQVPLTDEVLALLAELPRWVGGDFLFSSNGGSTRSNNMHKASKELRCRMLLTLRALARQRGDDPGRVQLPHFVLHDLRRTVRTQFSALRIPDVVAEMVVGHARKGIQRVYDQHHYQGEMREALTAWANKLRAIVNPPPATGGNVVPMLSMAS